MSGTLQEWIALGIVFTIALVAIGRYICKLLASEPQSGAACSGCDKQSNCDTHDGVTTKPIEFLVRK
ncbi:MAG: hypothetical protein AAF512_08540 [Pseudomonadota bacterium]